MLGLGFRVAWEYLWGPKHILGLGFRVSYAHMDPLGSSRARGAR